MARGWMTAHLRDADTNGDTKTLTPAQLRAKSERVAREFAPIQIASFDA